jgi:hypothetical protein
LDGKFAGEFQTVNGVDIIPISAYECLALFTTFNGCSSLDPCALLQGKVGAMTKVAQHFADVAADRCAKRPLTS